MGTQHIYLLVVLLEKADLRNFRRQTAVQKGMGGSASIQCREKNIFGHDGMMGSHGPISVGACYGNKKFTLCFAGDAAAEEDYFLAAIAMGIYQKASDLVHCGR